MEVPIKFLGGPLHKLDGKTSELDPILLFFDQKHRRVLAYKRTDELAYEFEIEMSQALTTNYDEAFAKFGATNSPVSWNT